MIYFLFRIIYAKCLSILILEIIKNITRLSYKFLRL